ncbi:DUF6114 domain-containing protein [Amycolatopsis alkalitolerans]|uniref:Uncharacterized protein n=1 Tax=Amycolatopsis alkalitolerans TaxID=2547244 RepID=A0A5C4LUL4_9PSEU|nr:DUF6114 domain-containing protein [Amycolatopsis alkalitolerans]TNC18876.1 hypothetical protein FG385_33240 [Amycolatopsis alkalitolerans]
MTQDNTEPITPDSASGDDTTAVPPRRKRFRQWRRSRPFWGGLLLLLAGAELLSLPLLNLIMLAKLGIVMSMGIGGISGLLLGIVLVVCGLLLWIDPAHRLFYAIIGLAGGVISFPGTNFGGFLIGLLLAITGGALAFGWTVRAPEAASSPSHKRGSSSALAVLVVTAVAATMSTTGRAEAATDPCLLIFTCPSPPSTGSPAPPVLPPLSSVLPVPVPTVVPPIGTPPGPAPGDAKSPDTTGAAGLRAYTAPVVLTAGSVRVTGFAYQGVAPMPTAGGGTVRMMKFTVGTLSAANGVKGNIGRSGRSTVLAASSMDFTGGVTLYATKFSGRLLGVPMTLTPGNAESELIRLLKSVTPAMPLTLTDVVAEQPIMQASSFQSVFGLSAA